MRNSSGLRAVDSYNWEQLPVTSEMGWREASDEDRTERSLGFAQILTPVQFSAHRAELPKGLSFHICLQRRKSSSALWKLIQGLQPSSHTAKPQPAFSWRPQNHGMGGAGRDLKAHPVPPLPLPQSSNSWTYIALAVSCISLLVLFIRHALLYMGRERKHN